MSWNPLHDSLLSSSVLAEGPDVVAVWALLIASADRNGTSELTVPFVASVLRIEDERVEEAFRVLSSPDPKSRNKEAEGRRIVPLNDGGWLLVSHGKYRERASRQAAADRQARYAAKKKALEEAAVTCEEPGCGGEVAGAVGGRKVCSAHAFLDAPREPGEDE
jgi:hypothetical protein